MYNIAEYNLIWCTRKGLVNMTKENINQFTNKMRKQFQDNENFSLFDYLCPTDNKKVLFVFIISKTYYDISAISDDLNEASSFLDGSFSSVKVVNFTNDDVQNIIDNKPFFDSRYFEIIDINSLKIPSEEELLYQRLLLNSLWLKYYCFSVEMDLLSMQATLELTQCLFLVQNYEYVKVSEVFDHLFVESYNPKISIFIFGLDRELHGKRMYDVIEKSITQATKEKKISLNKNLMKWNDKKIIFIQIDSNVAKKDIRDATFERIYCLLTRTFPNIALKGSYSYKYFTSDIERVIYDLDLVFDVQSEHQKISLASKLLSQLSDEKYIFSIREKIFQSACVFVKNNDENILTKIVIEILCNALVLGDNDFVKVKPMFKSNSDIDVKLRVNKIEISFVSKLGALSSFFRKDDSFHEKKMSSIYDICILLHTPEIKNMINDRKEFEKYITNKIIEDYFVQTQYGKYFTRDDVYINKIDELICSKNTMENLEQYVLLNKLQLRHSINELTLFLKEYYKILRLLLDKTIANLENSFYNENVII